MTDKCFTPIRKDDTLVQTDHLHGYVRRVDAMGNDRRIVEAARVSFNKDDLPSIMEKDTKLLRYLLEHKHSTPFEHVVVTFEVQAPIFVFRQWHRHRTQSYNEISARYTPMDDLFYVPEPAAVGQQSPSSKQARVAVEMTDELFAARVSECDAVQQHSEESYAFYQGLLGAGWPRELARTVLPVNVYSRMYATANLWNWLKFLDLRLHAHAQQEIRYCADAIQDLLSDVAPVTMQLAAELRSRGWQSAAS